MTPRGSAFHHRIENGEQFPHAGRQRQLLCLARLTQALIEGANHRIPPCGHQCRHVERGADVRPPTPNCPSPFERAAVSWKRRDAGQGGYLLARQGSQLREIGKECRGQYGTHPWHTPQDRFFLAPDWALANGGGQIAIRRDKFLLQPGDVGLHPFLDGPGCEAQAILFGCQHLDQLPTPRHECCERLRLLIGDRAHWGANRFGKRAST